MRAPGLLRVGADAEVVMMLCTAGHVDHGKTSLVKLLTGCNTDRLKVEQERGMTIELGFAPCVLGGELCVGIVDVPGHEKFVRNMVAGVSGINLTVLVIAADDGIMPQTIEHFQIMDLLGVRQGMIALTKIDLVTPERLAEVHREIEAFFAGTFLASAPICPLSSETGEGVFDFYEKLVARVRSVVKQRRRGVFRMPVERVFAQHGFGVVTTGIPVDGRVAAGDEVEVVPGGQRGRVRAMQQFLRNRTAGEYGQCLALNVPEFGKTPPERGHVVCRPGWMRPATEFFVDLRTVSGLAHPVLHAEHVKFHTGTAEVVGRIFLLEAKAMGEGMRMIAGIALREPVAAAVHDRFILRRPSPAVTIGGGEILHVGAMPPRMKKEEFVSQLKAYRDLFLETDPASDEGIGRDILFALQRRWPLGANVPELARQLLMPETVVRECAAALPGVIALGQACFIHEDVYRERLAQMRARLDAAEEKRALSLTLAELRPADWPAALWARIQADLQQEGGMAVRGGRIVLHQAFERLPAQDRELAARLIQLYQDTEFQSPRPEELPDQLNAPPQKIDRLLDYLCSEGRLVRLAKNVVLSREAYRQAQDIVVETIRQKGAIDSADFKNMINSTRKYALAILDYLDARRVTVRNDNIRRLAAGYERNLVRD